MRSSEREISAIGNEDGVTAAEYALLLACVFLAVFAVVGTLGLIVTGLFASVPSFFTS